MKKITCVIIAVAMLVLCFALSACGNKYVSRYNGYADGENKHLKQSVGFV